MPNQKEFKQFVTKNSYANSLQLDNYLADVKNMTRAVIEERGGHFREVDVFSRLIMERIIFLGTGIDDNIANIIIAQLLFLESIDPKKDIKLYINSPGGSVSAALGIYDTMQYITPQIATICTGLAASMGAVLLTGGTKGKRSALPHARIMIHQPLGGAQGQVADMEITLEQMMQSRKDIYTILASHTGQDYETIKRDADRDYWMDATKAIHYGEHGLIDHVLEKTHT